ncbi:MAG: hypothetical protein OFPI_26180 [Osedax symbiont Rs2]|nr:MAG: hypothetical protein OFPI_26180 [Osedax symbiont Rs2]
MHQQLRHQYLETLGISSWLSRAALPGASSSASWVSEFVYDADFPGADSVAKATENTDQIASSESNVQHSSRSLAASLTTSNTTDKADLAPSNILPPTTAVPVVATTEQQQQQQQLQPQARGNVEETDLPAAAATTQSPAEMPRHTAIATASHKKPPTMRLMFLQYKDVLVVDTLPSQSRGSIASDQYQQLTANILRAMGLDSNRLNAGTAPYVLNWPTLAGDNIDQGWDQAVSAVQHKLAKIFQQQTPTLVLMLGEAAAQMVMSREEEFESMRAIVFSLGTQTKAITSYSLTQMLNVPGCKRDVWQDLQKVLAVKG